MERLFLPLRKALLELGDRLIEKNQSDTVAAIFIDRVVDHIDVIAFMFIPQAILPLLALVYASGIVRDEQEEQTMTYLLICPIPKWALYLGKLFATLTTTIFWPWR
jgi:ABC-type transport system involved in multi-copper enzyme maturation permease subunit